jgi:hypothetical protein
MRNKTATGKRIRARGIRIGFLEFRKFYEENHRKNVLPDVRTLKGKKNDKKNMVFTPLSGNLSCI